ncbi:MAG: nucleotide exchange factor GrpE [Bacteroidetes bacterium]|nr:nucleotide exchange factor GrpE [Bacteroidota bacterium]
MFSENTVDETETTEQETIVDEEPSLETELAEAKEKFLRLYADFENFRRRTNKERIDLLSTASESVLKDMIPIVDDFERAILNNENVEDSKLLKEGFQLIFNKLKSTLESKGLKPMISKGEVFDSELHEAIANIPAPKEKLKGKVIEDVEKGYYLNEKVIRFAKVVVGQ